MTVYLDKTPAEAWAAAERHTAIINGWIFAPEEYREELKAFYDREAGK